MDATTLHLLDGSNYRLLDRVHEDVFDNPVRGELLAAFIANPMNHLVVAVSEEAEQGTVVGMASAIAYVHPDKPLQLFINEVGVALPYQRQGIGRRLVAELLKHAARLGCVEAWVATEVDNVAARALYRAAGGQEDPVRAVVITYKLTP